MSSAPLLAGLSKLCREVDRRFFASAAPYAETIRRARHSAVLAASLAGGFSSLALVLAFVGIYAVTAYHVAQRTREIGLRMALGARPRAILRLVTAQHLRPVLLGSALGMAGAMALGRLLTSLLFGISPADPRALLMTLLALAVTVLLATWTPARRATAVDPAQALRHE